MRLLPEAFMKKNSKEDVLQMQTRLDCQFDGVQRMDSEQIKVYYA